MDRFFVEFINWGRKRFVSVKKTTESFKVYDASKANLVSLEELAESVADADVLFFGEEHDDSTGHAIQDSLYGLLLDRYGSVALSMEMFEMDCQPVVDEYLAGFITESKLISDGRAWKKYKEHYKPLLERALELLPPASQKYLPPLPIYTSDSAYFKKITQSPKAHNTADSL